jgi:tetratricopeptide (TPR) repeat protein
VIDGTHRRGELRTGRWGSILAFSFCALSIASAGAELGAQEGNSAEAALNRALDLEGANKCREAIPFYRQAVVVEDPSGAVLGLERCYYVIGRPDSMLPLLDSILVRRPRDPTVRSVQLRTLSLMHDDRAMWQAFEAWAALAPTEPSPYRVYARLLLEQGRALAADSVLTQAVKHMGASRALASEFAQMQTALGLWTKAAASWRDASDDMSYLEQAAIFSLAPVPPPLRDSLRLVLGAEPVTLSARRVLAGLELRWNAPRSAWAVLSQVPASDSAIQAWIDFARAAEDAETWLTARDAYAQAARHRPGDRNLLLRAASSAINGGEPSSALVLLDSLGTSRDSVIAPTVALLRIRALSLVGRPSDIEAIMNRERSHLDAEAVRSAHRALAWAWIRTGNLPRARKALEAAGVGGEEDDRVAAWIALYEGDLAAARRGLRRTDESSGDVVTAMALISRTTAERSTTVGEAFLLLSRRDTVGAAKRFLTAATELKDAAPFLLSAAARFFVAGRDTTRAIEVWSGILDKFADAPEAAEADLEWARVLRQRSDTAGAIERLEHLILTYPQSALVPQGRRELDLVRGRIPPD